MVMVEAVKEPIGVGHKYSSAGNFVWPYLLMLAVLASVSREKENYLE